MKLIVRKLLCCMILFTSLMGNAHSSWKDHAEDMYDVFGFVQSAEITEWMRYISSDMIDGYNKEKIYLAESNYVGFYDYLKYKFPGFKCKHRLLFHWGYNSRPWTPELQKKVETLKWDADKIAEFQQVLVTEQARRNRIVNEMTENLFGFGHGGSEARMARAIVSIAYDVHLLGDYMPDNNDLYGLRDLSSVIGDLINNLRIIDNINTKSLIKNIQTISRNGDENKIQAAAIMQLLKSDLRKILRQNKDSRIYKRITPADFDISNNAFSQ